MNKNKQVPIQLPSITRTLEIIQFILFENHMDGHRYLEPFMGYDINYLNIWYLIEYGCFTARS